MNPILVDGDNGIICGHGRLEGAKLLGIDHVPIIELKHLNEAQKRAYIIADNRLAEKAGWDQGLLALELDYLNSLDIEFDLTITGFEDPEIDVILETVTKPLSPEDEGIPMLAKIPNDRKIAELYSKGSLIYTEFPEVKTELENIYQVIINKQA